MNLEDFTQDVIDLNPRLDFDKMQATIDYMKNLTDDEIADFNEFFYKAIEEAGEIAWNEYGFLSTSAVEYFKLKLFVEFYDKVLAK